jgi:pyruvate ferredoxin oxidoreductase alpha subunit
MAFPEYFEEFQRDKYESMAMAEKVFDDAASEFEQLFNRKHSRLETYLADDAEYILIGLGTMMGTAMDCVDELRSQGHKVGLLKIKCYRPFPINEIVKAASDCKAIGVLDRDVAYGSGGIVYQDVCRSIYNKRSDAFVLNFILGLGGRDVTQKTIKTCFNQLMELDSENPPEPGKDVFWPDENVKLIKTWKVGG